MVDLSSAQSLNLGAGEILDGDGNSVPSALDYTAGTTSYTDASSLLGLPPGSLVIQNPGFIVEQDGALDGSPITITMPGFGTDAANALTVGVGNSVLFGFDAPTLMGGTLTLEVAAVPVPAAAWLFGSALVGLAGIGRNRK